MSRYIQQFITALLLLTSSITVNALTAFTIEDIRFQGLQGVSPATMLRYMPIGVGDEIDDEKSTTVIQELFRTGFFEDVSLARDGNTLIVKVSERPVIGHLIIVGNKKIKDDDLTPVLEGLGVEQGRPFNPSVLERIKISLQNEYLKLGQTDAVVEVITKDVSSNRVNVEIRIQESGVRKIKRIDFKGNKAFTSRQLRKQIHLSRPGLLTFFTKRHEFSEDKLDHDLEAIRIFYLNHGYLDFEITDYQIVPIDGNKRVNLIITVSEGEQYTLTNYTFSGDLIVQEQVLRENTRLKINTPFSRQSIIDANQAISTTLGNEGHVFSRIDVQPVVDEKNRTVDVNFDINPGQLIYVRHINFSGNTKTSDRVLRLPFRQLEGSLVNHDRLTESVRQLNLLGFVKNVDYSFTPVEDTNNQVDVDVMLEEMPAATIAAGFGYSTTEKLILETSLTQPNFLGSGRLVAFNFQRSDYRKVYQMQYRNPYYTIDGVSQGIRAYAESYDPSKLNAFTTQYTWDTFGFDVDYGIPLDDRNSFLIGFGFERVVLKLGSTPATYITDFTNRHGLEFNTVNLYSGWRYDSRDRHVLPTSGWIQQFNAKVTIPVTEHTIRYYTLSYDTRWYQPLTRDREWIFALRGGSVYGNGYGSTEKLPFYRNYFGGGLDTPVPIAGIEAARLGPRSGNDYTGGNFGLYGRMGIILPSFNDNMRTMAFIDGANIYDLSTQNLDLGALRYSAGVSMEWQIPLFGSFVFSLAKPIRKFDGDEEQIFQFTIGASL